MRDSVANLLLALAIAGFSAGLFIHLPSAITWGIPSALLVTGFVFKESNGRIPSFVKKWSFLGDSSYSLYLLHIVLIDAVVMMAIYLNASIGARVSPIGHIGVVIICFAVTAFCVIAALISYQLAERRVIGLLSSLYRRKSAADPGMIQPR